ncbi:MAG: hypothetical protein RL660_1941 [Bacteroidota bacterium]|jgi:hypothetical protein
MSNAARIKMMPMSDAERTAMWRSSWINLRGVVIAYLFFLSAVFAMCNMFIHHKYGRYFVANRFLMENYEALRGTYKDTSLSEQAYYRGVLIFAGLVFLGLIGNVLFTILPKWRDAKLGHKVIELATVEEVVGTPTGYVLVTNSPLHPSFQMADGDNIVPSAGQPIIIAYYKYTNVFIGYYWE